MYKIAKIVGQGSFKTADWLVEALGSGILEKEYPALYAMSTAKHNKDTHPEGDTVFDHVVAALRTRNYTEPTVVAGILFHDIGKPVSKYYERGGWRYAGHDRDGVKLFDTLETDLTEPQTAIVRFCIKYHMRNRDLKKLSHNKIYALYKDNDNWNVLCFVMYADSAARGKPLFDEEAFMDRICHAEEIGDSFLEKEEEKAKLKALINGRMIIDMYPNIEGKDIGMIKSQVIEAIKECNFNIDVEGVKALIEFKANSCWVGYNNESPELD